MITSRHNPKIQWVKLLQSSVRERRAQGVFVVDGVRLAEEAWRSGWEVRLLLASETLGARDARYARGRKLLHDMQQKNIPLEWLTEEVMQYASETQSPQGILVVLAMHEPAIPQPLHFVLILDGVRDPGNLGTILRTAAATAVQVVFLLPGAVDAFSPKVLRAGMGAHFRLPVKSASWQEIQPLLHADGLNVVVAEAGGEIPYTRQDFTQPTALVIGGEAQGVSTHTQSLAQQRVTIPMQPGVESLNAAMAATVLCFEVARQRGDPS